MIDSELGGKYFTHLVQINNLNGAELGAIAGVSGACALNWIKGDNLPSLENINKVAEAFGVPTWVVVMQMQLELQPPILNGGLNINDAVMAIVERSNTPGAFRAYKRLPKGAGMKAIERITRLEVGAYADEEAETETEEISAPESAQPETN